MGFANRAHWLAWRWFKLGYSPTWTGLGRVVGWSGYLKLGPLELRVHWES